MSTKPNIISEPGNSAQKFARTISATRKERLGDIQTLKDFISSATGRLTLDDRKIIVEQALILLERSYVHLPLKRAMHAVDPVRVEERVGTPIEELGITPDIKYDMSSRDLLEDNVDLIKKGV
ncbi:MAG TPA: hypothetical protein VKA95_06910 [Nitrososphaeraceae archaeon]|nr:hypothetical protein [Nitrososphaeraceae archaeon]